MEDAVPVFEKHFFLYEHRRNSFRLVGFDHRKPQPNPATTSKQQANSGSANLATKKERRRRLNPKQIRR
ncbi:MAG: hypothetical protein LBE75_01110 [Burkholderiales bacterium]|nr:hypothetical protein [Burkholderiales bacterium]